ncbi:MAG: type II toxin-antitoxin system VapC family toxin [Desulfobacterales bacterium]|nr:type II toxin-antitoxin system VapC family toxin [Desulfobacterales bacterium]
MFLWDANIFRAFVDKHPNLFIYLKEIHWSEIALPSVVVAEILRGRCEHALKADPIEKLPFAHRLLAETQERLNMFNVVVFDDKCVRELKKLKQKHKRHKRYADMMIAAMALSERHIVVTRNQKDYKDLLPKNQLVNWIDQKPD